MLPGGRLKGETLILQSPRIVRASLVLVRPPHPFVVVSQIWPSALIPILSLNLPLSGAFFPAKYHGYFHRATIANSDVKPWLPLPALANTVFDKPVIFLVYHSLGQILLNSSGLYNTDPSSHPCRRSSRGATSRRT